MCIEEVYLIVSLIILVYLSYRTITNMIRRSKGLPAKKYMFMYSCLSNFTNTFGDDHRTYYEILICGVILALFWGIHWPVYIIYICINICITRIILPLLTRLTLSKEERVQIAIGATIIDEKWKK